MWYRIVKSQINIGTVGNGASDIQILPQNQISNKLRPELVKILKDLNISDEEFCAMPEEAQKSIWDILVTKNDTNLYNSVNDSDTPGFDATEARRHSPHHTNPTETTLEEQLEATRHDTVNNTPNNMLQREKGNGGMFLLNGAGAAQYASGKGGRLFYDNLPSNITLV